MWIGYFSISIKELREEIAKTEQMTRTIEMSFHTNFLCRVVCFSTCIETQMKELNFAFLEQIESQFLGTSILFSILGISSK